MFILAKTNRVVEKIVGRIDRNTNCRYMLRQVHAESMQR